MGKLPIHLQRRVLERIANSKGIPIDVIDWSLLDETLTYDENKPKIMKQIEQFSLKPNEIMAEKHQEDEKKAFEEKQRTVEEALAKKEFEKAIETIKGKPTPLIDKYFETPINLIKAFYKSKEINSLIFDGLAGLGKTTICFQTLTRELGLKPNKDFVIISGHLTPLELYHILWKYQEQVILIDDIGDLLENVQSRSILLSSTWNPTGIRTVKWLTTSPKLEAPKEFNFKGKVIFCVNYLPDELTALKSRSYYYKFNFDWETKLKIAYEIAKIRNIPFEMIDWIKTRRLYDFDFRLPIKIKELGNDWKELADDITESNEKLVILAELINSIKTVGEQIAEWQRRTGYSRASFFNYKKKYFPK